MTPSVARKRGQTERVRGHPALRGKARPGAPELRAEGLHREATADGKSAYCFLRKGAVRLRPARSL